MAARAGSRQSREYRGASLSALAGLEARIGLVDDVDASLAPHDAAVLVALLQRLQRIGDLHDTDPRKARNIGSGMPPVNPCQSPGISPCRCSRTRSGWI